MARMLNSARVPCPRAILTQPCQDNRWLHLVIRGSRRQRQWVTLAAHFVTLEIILRDSLADILRGSA